MAQYAQKGIADTFQKLLDMKNNRKAMRLDSVLLPIVIDLISEHGYSFLHSIFWDKFRSVIPGQQDQNKPNEYHTRRLSELYTEPLSQVTYRIS